MYLQRIIPGHLKLDSDESHEVLKAAWQSWSAGVPKLLIVAAILVAIISGLMWLQMLITP